MGLGSALLRGLIAAAEDEEYWTLQAQIMDANAASRALHLKCGFREVGIRERLGHLDGVWHDVMLYEYRSPKTGAPACRPADAGVTPQNPCHLDSVPPCPKFFVENSSCFLSRLGAPRKTAQKKGQNDAQKHRYA